MQNVQLEMINVLNSEPCAERFQIVPYSTKLTQFSDLSDDLLCLKMPETDCT